MNNSINFYNPYLTKQCNTDNSQFIKNLYHSISPNNKYFIIEQHNIKYYGINEYNETIIKLFEICEGNTGTTINFCKNLVEGKIKFGGVIWSTTGNMLICEYETIINDSEIYHIVYFDLTDDCRQFDLFADKKYEWEHNMILSDDDSMLVTVYNSEYIRIFAFDHVNKKYVFRYEKKFDNEITNIHLTSDNKLIITKCNMLKYCIINAYQISDDLSELIELNSIRFYTNYIFTHKLLNCIDKTYLLYSLADNIFTTPKSIIIYNLITLNIHEVIEFKDFDIEYIDFYNNQIICSDINGECNLFNILTHMLTPLINTHNIISKSYHANYFMNDKYHIYQFDTDNKQYIFNKKFKLYANGQYKSIPDISEIYPIHIAPNYIIIEKYDGTSANLYIANSIQFCNRKNCDLLIQLLYEYIPVELYKYIYNYI